MHDEFQDCIALNTVTAARALTRRYDTQLRPFGVSMAQFNVMVSVRRFEDLPVSEIAKNILMDRTTLLRNLELLERKNIIVARPAEKRNGRRFKLTSEGDELLDELIPMWRKAQSDLRETLHGFDEATLLKALQLLAAG